MPGQLETPSKEMLDLETATVLKEGRDPTKHLMTETQSKAYQAGQIDLEVPSPKLQPITTGPYATSSPAQAVAQPQRVEPQGTAPQPAQTVQPQAQVLPTNEPALLSQQQVPVTPSDSAPVKKRINQLYGQMRSAQEERDVFAGQVASLEEKISRLEQATGGQSPTFTLENPYTPHPAPSEGPPAGYISRDEFKREMAQLTQAITRQNTLSDAQRSSRGEVERDFSQHLSDPEFNTSYETILQQDFRDDPNGPMKAAIMARGMLAEGPALQAAPGASADAARRQALGTVGPSVAEGGVAPANDQVSRYNQAIEHATRTQKEEDFAYALKIKYGLA